MASTSDRDEVKRTPVALVSAPLPAPVSAPIPAIVPAQVSVPAPALPPPSTHVISTSQVMAAKDPSPQTRSDLRYRGLLDSGASVHISNNLSHFTTLDTNPALCPLVAYGDGESTKASGVGTVRIKGDQGQVITLTGALWIPSNAMCLFLIKRVGGREGTTVFHDNKCMIYQGQVLVFYTVNDPHSNYLSNPVLENKNAQDLLPPGFILPSCAMISHVQNASAQIWHARYGHLSYRNMEKLL
jgi:hypothetical protein